jgi:pyrroline-5-carboxylate reductase
LAVLAIKPQLVGQVAAAFAGERHLPSLLLSILAGVPLARLGELFPNAVPVRFMGNLAAAFGRSPVAVCAGQALDPAASALVDHVLAPLGPVEWLADEDQLHAVTALAGSGPGFVYRFLDALAHGGAALGLPPEAAARMALATVAGAAELAARSGEEFAALAARVASKGGTTEAGLAVLDGDDGLRKLVAATLEAARTRSRQLAGEE